MPDLDCAPIDPASAPYEDALGSIPRDACATFEYAYMGRLDDAMAPGLVLAAFPGRRKWCQDARVLDAVLANHPSGILPSTSLQQDNGRDPPPTMWTLGLGRTLTDHFAWGSTNVVAVFSHVAMRRPGSDAAPLEPLLRDRNTSVGTLLVSLPTYLEGGALSVHFNGARTVSDNDHRVCSTYSVTAAHRAATLTMAPIMAGHAVVAVYDLVSDSAMSVSTSPISPGVLAAIAMLTTIATAPPTKYPLLGFGIRPSYTFTTFDDLESGSQERAFVHALVATEMYDVAMVHYLPVPADDDDTGPFLIARAALHPALGLPSRCALALRGRLVPAFLCSVRVEDLRRSRDYRSTSLVFWHKVHRPIVLGFEAATDALAATPEKPMRRTDALAATPETPMRRDLVEGLLEHYVDACDALAATRKTWASTATLAQQLNAFGDVHLVEKLWHTLSFRVAPELLVVMAPSIHAALDRFESLVPSLHGLMHCWKRDAWGSVAMGCRLLASLAGVSLAPLCPRLTRPDARAAIVEAHIILFSPIDIERTGSTTPERMCSLLRDGLRLEAYVQDMSEHRLRTLVTDHAALFHPQSVVAPALHALLPTRVPWCEALLCSMLHIAPIGAVDAATASAVLHVLQAIGALDASTLTALATMWGNMTLDAMAMFLETLDDDAVVLHEHVHSVMATTMLKAIQANASLATRGWRDVASSTARLVLFMQRYWPTLIDGFLASVVEAIGGALALHHAFLWPLLQEASCLGLALASQRQLAAAMLPVLATDDRDARSLAITNIVLTPCCRNCRRFEAFLKSPTDSEWHIEWYEDSRSTWCATLEAFAAHLPMRLEVALTSHGIYPNVCVATFRKRLDNRDHDPEEVRPGHRARTLAKIARLRECLGEQNKHASDDDGADEDGPPTKRVKPSESC